MGQWVPRRKQLLLPGKQSNREGKPQGLSDGCDSNDSGLGLESPPVPTQERRTGGPAFRARAAPTSPSRPGRPAPSLDPGPLPVSGATYGLVPPPPAADPPSPFLTRPLRLRTDRVTAWPRTAPSALQNPLVAPQTLSEDTTPRVRSY